MKHFMASMVYHEPTYRVQGTYLTCQSIPTMGFLFFIELLSAYICRLARTHCAPIAHVCLYHLSRLLSSLDAYVHTYSRSRSRSHTTYGVSAGHPSVDVDIARGLSTGRNHREREPRTVRTL